MDDFLIRSRAISTVHASALNAEVSFQMFF